MILRGIAMSKAVTTIGYKSYSDEAYDQAVRQPASEDAAEQYRRAVEKEIKERSLHIPEERPGKAAAAANSRF